MVCESLIREIIGEVGSGFFGLYVKGTLWVWERERAGRVICYLRISYPWEGQSFQDQGPKCQSIKNIENKKV